LRILLERWLLSAACNTSACFELALAAALKRSYQLQQRKDLHTVIRILCLFRVPINRSSTCSTVARILCAGIVRIRTAPGNLAKPHVYYGKLSI
jgi:hypothetical protein